MRRILIIIAFIVLPFLFVTRTSFAQDITIDRCISGYGVHPFTACGGFFTDIYNCMKNGRDGQRLDSSVFDPLTYACTDNNSNGTFESDEITACKNKFTEYVCANADPAVGGPGSCSCSTSVAFDGIINAASTTLPRLFEEGYYKSHIITPAPTPTLTPEPIPTINGIIPGNPLPEICNTEYEKVITGLSPENNSYDSAIRECNVSSVVIDPYTNCFNTFYNNEISEASCKDINGTNKIIVDAALREIQQLYNNRRATLLTEAGISTTPPVVPTPTGPTPIPFIGLYDKLLNPQGPQNCGTLDSACCQNATEADLPGEERFELPSPPGETDSNWSKFVGWVSDTFTRPFKPIVRTFSNVTENITKDYIVPDARFYCTEGSAYKEFDDHGTVTSCKCINASTRLVQMCKNIDPQNTDELTQCESCVKKGFWTAIGCVDSDFQLFIQKTVFGWGLGLAGVTALLCIIYSSFRLQISANNPEQIKGAQELLTSCITGLIVIIFSVMILRIIGVDILRIPFLQ